VIEKGRQIKQTNKQKQKIKTKQAKVANMLIKNGQNATKTTDLGASMIATEFYLFPPI
jgi:hypothetical protein